MQFIASKLPCRTFSLPEVQVHRCLSKLQSNEINGKWFKNRTLPPRQLVEKLDKQFRQAVLNGMQSVVDPAYPGSRLPLWSIQFWKDMWGMHDAQEEWKGGVVWLEERIKKSVTEEKKVYTDAHALTKTLRWSEETSIPGANQTTTQKFAAYLSDKTMMSTIHVDMMFSDLADRMEEDETLDSLVKIETLRF